MVLSALFLFLIIGGFAESANILAITTMASPSHHIFNDVYLLELAKRGHNVTLLSHHFDKHHNPNYTHIVMEGIYEQMAATSDLIAMKNDTYLEAILGFYELRHVICELDMQTEGLKTITGYPDDFKFDLIVWDLCSNFCLLPLVEKFGRPPVIATNPFINQPNSYQNVYQSYIPHMLFPYTDRMTFWQRLVSNFWALTLNSLKHFIYIPRARAMAKSYFGEFNLTAYEFERGISLVLANYNPAFSYVEALPPNFVPVGGLHIKPRPLPKDLQEILDNAKGGVILFSLGTNIKSKNLSRKRIETFLEVFSRLDQTVIWKFENQTLGNVPKNVIIRPWVPQNDILGHPNTVLFITHCGLLSSTEIAYNGVPVVGIPFFLDQILNGGNMVAKGIGETIDFDSINEDNFYNIIHKVLTNTSYAENAQRLSKIFKHVQNEPLESAMWWTEYVLEHGSASHLDLATRDMNFVQLLNLDLIVVFFIAPLAIMMALGCLICSVFKWINRRNKIGGNKRKLE